MKAVTIPTLLSLLSVGIAQTLGPSPTESVHCKPHGDHWHCEDHVSETGTATKALAPAPSESYNCKPHGDHWHCEGPITIANMTTVSATVHTVTNAHDDHDHYLLHGGEEHDHEGHAHEELETPSHSSGTGAAAPSPTESTGCVAHGDHWHCEGPAATGASTDSTAGVAAQVAPMAVALAAAVIAL